MWTMLVQQALTLVGVSLAEQPPAPVLASGVSVYLMSIAMVHFLTAPRLRVRSPALPRLWLRRVAMAECAAALAFPFIARRSWEAVFAFSFGSRLVYSLILVCLCVRDGWQRDDAFV
ncbi:MAG: hypothetical protein COZ06_26645 [Armatimonadetes bacterium CG_4_10_14_3_um_filter_66_18]|nr:MAG: hypothetical protein COZ57_16880 [Armatimonadetes bacterium CG_4_8_14_3_um_filter_66_20]PIY41414.1 MAG: hypothetical protein COZ06_26645 [Armatimonadetes bacterium CG_4_10_14_3_um_filter_66_18]